MSRFPRLEETVKNIDEYLTQHTKNSERLQVFLLSLATRIVKYLFVYILFEGVIQLGVSLGNFSLFSFGLAGTELSALIPIQGPGGFGTWESGWALTLMLLGFEKRIAIVSSGVHLVTNVFEYFLGLMSILFLALPIYKRKSTPN